MDAKIYLAPVSGVTDLAFRLISRGLGARQCFFEMLDSKAMIYDLPASLRRLKTLEEDRPIAAQLLGEDPSIMLDAAEKLLSLVNVSFLDINSACPAKKVIKKGAGAALLENGAELGRIVRKLASAVRIPVTVKIRTGLYKTDVGECVENARICQANGASGISIHGRTASQGYSGSVDYGTIKAVKEALTIPVFGSGDIFNPFMAKKMLDETGCDGILVARGALGNPWIFKDIENYLKNGVTAEKQSLSAKKDVLKKHLAYIEKYKDLPRPTKMGFMGKVAVWYLKGLPGAARIRESIHKAKSYKGLVDLIDGISG